MITELAPTSADMVEITLSESLPAFLEQRRALAEKLAASPGPHLLDELTQLIRRAGEIERLVRDFVVYGLYDGRRSNPLITDDRGKLIRDPEQIRLFLMANPGSREILASLVFDELKTRTGNGRLIVFSDPMDRARQEAQTTLIAQAAWRASQR